MNPVVYYSMNQKQIIMKEQKYIIASEEAIKEIKKQNALILKAIEATMSSQDKVKTKASLKPTNELCKIFQVSRQTINNWRRRGLIQGYLVGGRYYFDLDEIIVHAKKLGLPG